MWYSIERISNILKTRKSLLWSLSVRQLAIRYRGSIFGFLWTLISPMLTLAVYSFVFGTLMKVSMENYWLYLFNGLIFWGIIAAIITESPGGLHAAGRLVASSGLPSEIVPFRIVTTHLLGYLMILPLYFCIYAVATKTIPWMALQLIVILPLLYLFCFFLSMILLYMGTIYRDVQPIATVLVQLLFFTSPVTYKAENLSERAQALLSLSPFTAIIKMNASACFFQEWIHPFDIFIMSIWLVMMGIMTLTIHSNLSNLAIEHI